MTRSSWPARRAAAKNQTPSAEPTRPPATRMAPSLWSRASRRSAPSTLVVEEATIWADWVRDRDRRRNAEEDQQRRHEKAAADAEQPRDEAHRRTHPEDEKNAHRHLGDRQIDLQPGSPMAGAATSLLQHHAGGCNGHVLNGR